MPRKIKFEGQSFTVPDDATDDEITQIVDSRKTSGAVDQALASVPRPASIPALTKTTGSHIGSPFAHLTGAQSPTITNAPEESGLETGPLIEHGEDPNAAGKKFTSTAVIPGLNLAIDPAAQRTVLRFLNRGKAIPEIPSMVRDAFMEPATGEELQKSPEVFKSPLRKGLRRLSGIDAIDNAESDYRAGRVTPEAALSVAPEALGDASTNVVAGKILDAGVKGVKGAVTTGIQKAPKVAKSLIDPLVYEGVGEAKADARFGVDPSKGILDEGLVGTKEGLAGDPTTRTPGKIKTRLGELKSAADNILQNHPNSRRLINAEPLIDSAIDSAVQSAKKVGASGTITRLESLREALKTQYGKLQGTPYEMNNLKMQLQDSANELGGYENAEPADASAAMAMKDAAHNIRGAVDTLVPEAADLNSRMSNLIDAQSGLERKIILEKGGTSRPGLNHGFVNSVIDKTIGSAPVRTGIARVLNAGKTLDVPGPMEYVPPQIRGLLNPAPTPLGSAMEPIGDPSAPPPTLDYHPSYQTPPAFVRPGEIRPAGPPMELLFPNESPGDFPADITPDQFDLFQKTVPKGKTNAGK